MQLNAGKKEILNTFLLVLGYGVFMYCFQLFLHRVRYVQLTADDASLFHWDAGCYLDIVKHGYRFNEFGGNNAGFFLLFPLIWRWLHLGVAGICVANYIFFSLGFAILTQICKINTIEKIIWLSTSMVYIMVTPYSEALFFLLMVILFYAITAKNRWLIWIILFLASLTRATVIFLMPALLIMELLSNHKKEWYKVVYTSFIDYVFPILIGLAFFIWYQYHSIGIWFAYFINQQQSEGHIFSMPIFPLSSMGGPRILWICALAVLCCFISLIIFIKKIVGWLFKDKQEPDKLFVLSLMFLSITLYKTIFYNPAWGTLTTLTIGINRYVFATPFFYVFLFHFTHRIAAYKPLHYLYAFLLCNIVWLSCGEYSHIQNFIFFNFLTMIVFLYMLLTDKKLTWPALAIVGINVLLQVIMFQQYLSGWYFE